MHAVSSHFSLRLMPHRPMDSVERLERMLCWHGRLQSEAQTMQATSWPLCRSSQAGNQMQTRLFQTEKSSFYLLFYSFLHPNKSPFHWMLFLMYFFCSKKNYYLLISFYNYRVIKFSFKWCSRFNYRFNYFIVF